MKAGRVKGLYEIGRGDKRATCGKDWDLTREDDWPIIRGEQGER
jgi:hypothetical protein